MSHSQKEPEILTNTENLTPLTSFYNLKATLSNGTPFDFEELKNKKVLIVNTASNCGFTRQFEALEALQIKASDNLVILAFPANDFKGQEPGTNEEIEQFCKINYKVSFPIFEKASVVKPGQQQVFEWLCSSDKNGWNNNDPSWNFCKYLVNEKGVLLGTFKSQVSPLDNEIVSLLTIS